MAGPAPLPFEKEICEMEELLAKMESSQNGQASDEIRRMRRELTNLIRKVYSNLSAWDTVRVSRHNDRPQTLDYIKLIFEEFVELHGDRALGDDRAIRTGTALPEVPPHGRLYRANRGECLSFGANFAGIPLDFAIKPRCPRSTGNHTMTWAPLSPRRR